MLSLYIVIILEVPSFTILIVFNITFHEQTEKLVLTLGFRGCIEMRRHVLSSYQQRKLIHNTPGVRLAWIVPIFDACARF